MNQLQTWLQSSQDPTQVANKVKGLVLLFSSIITLLAGLFFHITLSPTDMMTFATEAGVVVGAIWTVYGAILQLVTWMGSVQKTVPPNLPGAGNVYPH